jgi:hypothetical protein
MDYPLQYLEEEKLCRHGGDSFLLDSRYSISCGSEAARNGAWHIMLRDFDERDVSEAWKQESD